MPKNRSLPAVTDSSAVTAMLRRTADFHSRPKDKHGRWIACSESMYAFRVQFIYPALSKRYGEKHFEGAYLFFQHPRNIEEILNAVLNGVKDTPLCDGWDRDGISYDGSNLEI